MSFINRRSLALTISICATVAGGGCGAGTSISEDAGAPICTGGQGGGGGTGTGGGVGAVDGEAGRAGASAGSGGAGGNGGASGAGGSGTGGTGGATGTGGSGGGAGASGSSGSGGAAGSGGPGGAAGSGTKDGGADGAIPDVSTDGDGSVGMARMRIAHLVPNGPSLDVCWAPHGTSNFTGPVLAAAGLMVGLPFASVTRYLTLPAGQYDVRVVAAGSADCTTPFNSTPNSTSLPALSGGSSTTLALEGELNPGDAGPRPMFVTSYDDDTDVTSGKTKLRFIHAASFNGGLDAGFGGGVLFTPLFRNVVFGGTASANLGYVETSPIADAEFSVRLSGATSDLRVIKPANFAADRISTIFAVNTPSAPSNFQMLVCADNTAPSGILTPCTLLGDGPERAHLRLADVSPDAPQLDLCFTPAGTAFSGSPVLLGLSVVYGIAYAQVTAYLDLPTQTYDVRVVQAGSTDCTSNIVPDLTSVAGTAGLFATIGAIGDFYPIDAATPDAGLDPRIALKLWADEGGIAGGLAVLRFIHTASSLPSLDAGTITNGTFTKIFSDVSFGMTASGDGIDAKGYATIIPSGYAETISLRAAGSSVDALLVPFIALNPSSSQTMFAIGDKTFETAKPLKILFCATDTLLNSLPVSQQPLSQCDPRP